MEIEGFQFLEIGEIVVQISEVVVRKVDPGQIFPVEHHRVDGLVKIRPLERSELIIG